MQVAGLVLHCADVIWVVAASFRLKEMVRIRSREVCERFKTENIA